MKMNFTQSNFIDCLFILKKKVMLPLFVVDKIVLIWLSKLK